MDLLVAHFNLLRGLHILAVMAWMAGLLILPRLFIYHLRAAPGSEMEALFRSAEARTMKIILEPAMALAVLFGVGLILADSQIRGWGFLLKPWMLAKFLGLVFLFNWHGFLSRSQRRFAQGLNLRSEKFWRTTNELPFLAAILIVLSVTTKFLDA